MTNPFTKTADPNPFESCETTVLVERGDTNEIAGAYTSFETLERNKHSWTRRLFVFGGWIVQTALIGQGITSCFVPDPGHKWHVMFFDQAEGTDVDPALVEPEDEPSGQAYGTVAGDDVVDDQADLERLPGVRRAKELGHAPVSENGIVYCEHCDARAGEAAFDLACPGK